MDALQDEVESLVAILMNDVHIKRDASDAVEAIETTVFPVVGEEEEQQYICVTLQVLPTAGYPDVSPDFKLLRPRGLDDARLEAIRSACSAKLQESLGYPVVFDLMEVVREHLTGSNLPSGQCVICLYGFSEGDEFTRTECFHYLHSYCLARHLNALRRNYQEEYDNLPAWLQKTADPFKASCPVCRESIKDESDSLKCAMPPAELQNAPDFKLTRELRELQQRMSSLFLQQKSRGAIIDVDADGAAVISIESEEEIRRRKRREEETAAKHDTNHSDNNAVGTVFTATATEAQDYNADGGVKDATGKPTSSGQQLTTTNFTPLAVQQNSTRLVAEPTNNNYQHHNRRHYRGGRRHQHHHHHHHNRAEREAAASHSSTAAATVSTAAANASVTTNSAGKHSKAQAAGGAHGR